MVESRKLPCKFLLPAPEAEPALGFFRLGRFGLVRGFFLGGPGLWFLVRDAGVFFVRSAVRLRGLGIDGCALVHGFTPAGIRLRLLCSFTCGIIIGPWSYAENLSLILLLVKFRHCGKIQIPPAMIDPRVEGARR